MALKTAAKKPASPPVPESETTVLELALYKIYTWGDTTYEKGKPYRFRNADALRLLAEQDLGRPVWKIYQPPRKKEAPKNEIVDATSVSVGPEQDEFGDQTAPIPLPEKRIDVGSDDEIEDILNRPDGNEDVTV